MGQIILRLTIWFLLTANFTITNIIIGVLIAFLLPRGYPSRTTLKEWITVLGKILVAIPQAYLEAFEMILRPHRREETLLEQIPPHRTSSLIFLDIFLITFTPKTIVTQYDETGWYKVHYVKRGKGGILKENND